jgi:hypothetical protein
MGRKASHSLATERPRGSTVGGSGLIAERLARRREARRHPGQEELDVVLRGTATFKVGDDVFEAGPQIAVRMTGDDFYSVHNDADAEAKAELMIFSPARRPAGREAGGLLGMTAPGDSAAASHVSTRRGHASSLPSRPG